MARGKVADRVANRLGDHEVGKHIRGKKITEVLVSAIFALGILALVGVWAAATAGYESRAVFSPNWNLTDVDHWYSKFIPPTPGPLCQPAFINTGSTFRTTNGIFLWEMGKGFNVSATPINNNNNTKVNFNATTLTQYSDEVLDHCDVSGVAIDMDLHQATVTVQIYATCIDPKWPALLHTSNVYSMDPGRLRDDDLWFGTIVTPDPKDNASIPDSMNDLASDLWNRMKAVYLRSSNVLPTIRGLRMVNANNCALVTEDKRSCYDGPLKLSNNTDNFFLYPNLTIAESPERSQVDWNVTTNNFINAIFAAARYDFGANMTTNLFDNTTARQQLIVASDAAQLDNDTALMNSLDGATHFLQSPEFPALKVARVRTSYMCNVMKIKQTPAFIVAVLGLAFAIFGVVFAAAVAIVKKVTGKDFGATVPGPLAVLSPSTSRVSHAPVATAAAGEGEHKVRRRRRDTDKSLSTGSSGDYRLDSPRLDSRADTPAPSYHFNARPADAVYAPLNDRDAGGSGAITPSAKVSSFSSLTGLARGFADKLPFGSQLADKIPGLPRGVSDLSIPTSNRLSGSSSNWLSMAGGAAGGAAAAGLGAAAVNQMSDRNNLAVPGQSAFNAANLNPANLANTASLSNLANPANLANTANLGNFANTANFGNFANATNLGNFANTANLANPAKLAEEGHGMMIARPAQATQVEQLYQPNPASEYVPFAYPESIREASAEGTPPNAFAQQYSQPEFIQPGAAAPAQSAPSNPYLPAALAGAGALAVGGAGAAAYAAHSSGQPTAASQQQMLAVPNAQRPTITAVSSPSDAPARVGSPTTPGRPVGHTMSVPSRVTSPGPPMGHVASSPSRATSPGAPVGTRSVGAPARVTSPGPPVGVRSSGAPARVTSPGAPVGVRTGAPATMTAAGPPVDLAGPTPKIFAPQPRRAPSPTWLAEQEAAAAPSVPVAQVATAINPNLPSGGPSSANSGASLMSPTPNSDASHQSPLAQIQRDLMSSMTTAQNNVSGTISQTQSQAHNAANAAGQAFTNNPFGK